ncbi:hypothetical protein [Kitasatospora sp. NPDC050543]|uniref:hypothetical protein n=1 Tax=Kitasatospora sp. NPDC050543 TaxID=3364054 RepID=UPI00379C29A0
MRRVPRALIRALAAAAVLAAVTASSPDDWHWGGAVVTGSGTVRVDSDSSSDSVVLADWHWGQAVANEALPAQTLVVTTMEDWHWGN